MKTTKSGNTLNCYHDHYFDKRFVFDPRRDLVWKEVCNFLQKNYIPKDAKILDVGAGYCNFINNIIGREKHAVDIFQRFAEFANTDVATHIHSCTDLHFFKNDTFDTVFSSNLLEHLTRDDLSSTVNEWRRTLKPGGTLIILQPNFKYSYRNYFDDYTHLQIFTHESLSDLLEAHGFEIAVVIPRFLPINMKSTLRLRLPKLSLITRIYLNLPFRPFAGQMLVVAKKPKD